MGDTDTLAHSESDSDSTESGSQRLSNYIICGLLA